MEISRKETNLQRIKLLQAVINPDSKYLPVLHKQAKQVRENILLLDGYVTKGLAAFYASLTSVTPHLQTESINELRKELINETDEAKRRIIEDSLKELQTEYNQYANEFIGSFNDILRSMHIQRTSLEDSTLYENCDKEYGMKEKDMISHLKHIENTLVPMLNEIKNQLATVDASLKERLSANLFTEAVELLPSTINLKDLSGTQPELAAASLGYQFALSAIKGLGKMTDVVAYLDKHNELKRKVDEAEQTLDKEKQLYEAMKSDLDEIKNLYIVDTVSSYYIQLETNLEQELKIIYDTMNKAIEEKSDLSCHIEKLKEYLYSLDLIKV